MKTQSYDNSIKNTNRVVKSPRPGSLADPGLVPGPGERELPALYKENNLYLERKLPIPGDEQHIRAAPGLNLIAGQSEGGSNSRLPGLNVL